MSLPFILSFCFAKYIRVQSRNFVCLIWFRFYTLLHDLLHHDPLYCDETSSPNKLLTSVHRWVALLHVLFVLFKNISLGQSSLQMECLNSRFERLREVISPRPPQVLPHWQVLFKVCSSLKLFNLFLLDLVGNKSYDNLFFVRYWKILALGQNVTPSQAWGVTNNRGPIFFSNDHKKGYYMIYSQPTNHTANLNSTFF